jgi:hypothetical protein
VVTYKQTVLAAAFLAVMPFSAGAAETSSAPPGVVIDGRTERVLLDACAYLRSAERFSVQADISYDDVLKAGPKVEYSRQSSVVLERPNHLRVDTVSDKGARSFYYDGKSLTMYRPEGAIYAVGEAPATIDALLDVLEARGVVMPLDDLLETRPCGGLAEHLKTGSYAGRHFFDGSWYHHLLLETDAVDVQMWVAEGDQPEIRKVVITYRDAPAAPRYTAVLSDWNFAPAIDATTFAFSPPEGVRKVAYRDAADSQGGGK